jgi:AcrR family transcriptional regulator
MANPVEIAKEVVIDTGFETPASNTGTSNRDAPQAVRPPEVKRRRILAVATRLFAEQGFTKTTVEEIAATAMVSKGLVYVHFPSKEALLEKVLSLALVEWNEATQEATRGLGDSMAALIGSVLRTSIAYANSKPILRAILAQDPRVLLSHNLDRTDRLARNYTQAMEKLLRRGVERGELRSDLDVEYTAWSIWLIHRDVVTELFVASRSSQDVDAARLVDASVAMITSGFIAPTPCGGGRGPE